MLFFTSCHSGNQAKHVTITGAFALYPVAVKWIEAYKKDHPDVTFDISGGGAGKGLTDVLAGAADLGMFSRKLTQAELAKGVWYVTVTKDAVLPTFSNKNPLRDLIHRKGLTASQLADIFTSGQTTTWGAVLDTTSDQKINVYTRSDAAGAADTWAVYLNGGNQEDIKGIGIYGDPGLADAVGKDPQGIGFNNTGFVYDIKTGKKNPNIDVVPLDLNGDRSIDESESFYADMASVMQAIAEGKYPSPPARDLYFISKGKPTDPRIIDFLKWVLTDGQSFVREAGYVPVDQKTLDAQLEKLQ
jgi:phosphate transport system substrate-binding protein